MCMMYVCRYVYVCKYIHTCVIKAPSLYVFDSTLAACQPWSRAMHSDPGVSMYVEATHQSANTPAAQNSGDNEVC